MEGGPARWRKVSDAVAGFLRADGKLAPIYAFGRSDGHGGLSAVSLRQHKNVLNQTLKLAQRDGLIQTNPADLVVMPHAAQFTGTFYTEAQMRDLLTAVKNERLYPIIYVTALYGLRRSEVLGLKWDSINFAMQTLTIRHTVARVTKVVEKNKTKNASSFRSFPLTDDAVRLFKILLQQEQYYRNHFGKDYIDNDYVFTWEDGHPYSPDYVSHTFHKLLKKYDLPHIRFHDLRHPYVKPTTKKFASFLKFFRAAAIAARSCSIRYSWLMLPFQISPFLKSPA